MQLLFAKWQNMKILVSTHQAFPLHPFEIANECQIDLRGKVWLLS